MGEMSFFGSQRLVFGSLQVFPSTNGSPGESTFSGITRRSADVFARDWSSELRGAPQN